MINPDRNLPPQNPQRAMSAGELTDRYRPNLNILQFCSQQVQDYLTERNNLQKGEMSSMELMQLKNMRSIFDLVLPPEGSPIVLGSDLHVDDLQLKRSADEVAVPFSGLLSGEYLGVDIEEYRFKTAYRYFGLVVGACVEFQDGPRTITTPVLGSAVYFYSLN